MELTVKLHAEIDKDTWEKQEQFLREIYDKLQVRVVKIWKLTEEEARVFVADTAKDVSDTWDKTHQGLKEIGVKALKGSILPIFKGDMDAVEDIWENAWQSMIGKADALWNGFLDRSLDRAFKGLGNMFDKAVLEPSGNWLGGLASDGLRDVAGWLGVGPAAFNSWLGPAAGSMGPGMGGAMTQGLAVLGIDGAAAGAAGGVPAAIAEGWGITAGVTDVGVTSGTLGGGVTLGKSASLAGMAGLASPLGAFGLALGPGLLGMGLSSMGFLMDGPMSPAEARSNWQGQENFLGGLTGNLIAQRQDLAEIHDSRFALFGQAARKAAEDLERLSTVAGYTQQQLEGVTASLNPMAQELVASGQAANTLEAEVGQVVQQLNAAAGSFSLSGAEAQLFDQRIAGLAARLGLSGGEAEAFRQGIHQLADSFTLGGEEADAFGSKLDEFVAQTLSGLSEGAGNTAEAIRGLIEGMRGVKDVGNGLFARSEVDRGSKAGAGEAMAPPADPFSNAALGYYHGGGQVGGWPRAHAGALISSLARDEVPIIARRGEYVVRAESVTPATLPALQAINQGAAAGRAPEMTVNFTININGNLMGNDDQVEDMVRLIETRLRELQNSRWRA
jgi:hypothetical protein